jgi:hypothetical protein
MCDLFSHIFTAQRNHSKTRTHGGINGRVDDLAALLVSLRLKTTQWRRAFRKDVKSTDGEIPLDALTENFKTNSVILSQEAKQLLRKKYSATPARTTTLLANLRDPGSSQKGHNINLNFTRSKLPRGCNLSKRSGLGLGLSFIKVRIR